MMDRSDELFTDRSDGSVSILATNLENRFKVRDSLCKELIEALSDYSDVYKRLKSITIILNSILVNYGNLIVYDERNYVLSRNDLDRILSVQMLEEKVTRPLISGEYTNELQRESVKLLFAISAHLPLEEYSKLYSHELLITLISIAQQASMEMSGNREVWTSCISILRNVISHVEFPIEMLSRVVSCIFSIVDEPSVQLCNVIVVKIMFKRQNEAENKFPFMEANACFTMKLTRRIMEYLVTVLERTQDTSILTTSCDCLIAICEHAFGVDMFLESGGLNKITDLVLIVNTKHEAMLSLDKYNKRPDVSPKLTSSSPIMKVNQAFHEISFSALSVMSKVAYTSNHRQILHLINNEVPETLVKLLNCPLTSTKVKARACNTLGNLGCETDNEVQAVIDAEGLTVLMSTFQTELDHNVRVESAYAICACLSKANRKQIGYIISCNSKTNHLGDGSCIALISNMLDFIIKCDPTNESSVKLCRVVLNGMENILKMGEDETKMYKLTENPYIKMFREAEGDIKLSQVCFFPEYNIAKKATGILREYFNQETHGT
ncbi:hypothetical protein MACK_002601 [Theileria orientalis]|uniref:Importin subunit alpha n=1 Tax=Theileria orientalis TaxID=68886 RepID=A0A976MDP7_THEOR|nr:hypothetical protein MACK_002601 [Theileria orientalis]